MGGGGGGGGGGGRRKAGGEKKNHNIMLPRKTVNRTCTTLPTFFSSSGEKNSK